MTGGGSAPLQQRLTPPPLPPQVLRARRAAAGILGWLHVVPGLACVFFMWIRFRHLPLFLVDEVLGMALLAFWGGLFFAFWQLGSLLFARQRTHVLPKAINVATTFTIWAVGLAHRSG